MTDGWSLEKEPRTVLDPTDEIGWKRPSGRKEDCHGYKGFIGSSAKRGKDLSKVVRIDEARIGDHVNQVVRSTVEETLNGLLDAEAERLCGAKRYERPPDRVDTRAGHYERGLHTVQGEAALTAHPGRQVGKTPGDKSGASPPRVAGLPYCPQHGTAYGG